MAVLIDNRQNKLKMDEKRVRAKAQAILNALDNPEAELSIVLLDDAQIADLNAQYRRRQGPTNVIAFAMQDGEFGQINPNLLGDVVISLETAEREGRAEGNGLSDRLDQLLVHGILHLFGFDHEKGEDAAQVMEDKSRDLCEMLKSVDP